MTITDDIAKNFGATNLYQVLMVPYHATQDEIKKAYLQRSLELHPDKIADPTQRDSFTSKFQVLSEVYKILGDTQRRIEYDSQMQVTKQAIIDTDSPMHEEVPLINCDELDTLYSYDCRCSGHFILTKQNFRAQSWKGNQDHQDVFIVNCDSCSSSIRIITQ